MLMVEPDDRPVIESGSKNGNMMNGIRCSIEKMIDTRHGPEQIRATAGLLAELPDGGIGTGLAIPDLSPDHPPLAGIDHLFGSPEYQEPDLAVHNGVGIHINQGN